MINKTIQINANSYGDLFVTVYKDSTRKVTEGTYKFDGFIEGVDLKVGVPKGKRKEYAKITKIK